MYQSLAVFRKSRARGEGFYKHLSPFFADRVARSLKLLFPLPAPKPTSQTEDNTENGQGKVEASNSSPKTAKENSAKSGGVNKGEESGKARKGEDTSSPKPSEKDGKTTNVSRKPAKNLDSNRTTAKDTRDLTLPKKRRKNKNLAKK